MMLVVPDASVILKWVLQKGEEADSPVALRMLEYFLADRIEIRLPSLWRYEVGNILGMKTPHMASEAMETLLAYEFDEEALHREYCLAVLRLMREVRRISFYDASYHVLALRAKGTYVTADLDYMKKARRKGHIALLSDWSPPTRSH